MMYFQRLSEGNAFVIPVIHVLTRNSHWWGEDPVRTSFEGSPHAQATDVLLRSCKTTDRDLTEAFVDLDASDRIHFYQLPTAKEAIFDLMRMVRGTRLGRVVVTRLPPGSKITPHVDEGAYAEYYSRYHIVLQGLPGSLFICGDETVQMTTGEIWWFDHQTQHSVVNNSQDDRVHLIADIRID